LSIHNPDPEDLVLEMLSAVAELAVAQGMSTEEFIESAAEAFSECMGEEVVNCEIALKTREKEPSN
jgi:hypothetical protein